jgi:3-oxoacyl-[acyl-carrier-protein] synthase-3
MTEERVKEGEHLMEMERGQTVFREAVDGMVRTGRTVLEEAGRTPEEIDWWIPHQANRRITDQAGAELGIPEEKTVSVIEEYGNSSAATIPLGLSLALQDGRIARGDRLLLTAIGAGMIEAGVLAVW